jgi:hypothetical protein
MPRLRTIMLDAEGGSDLSMVIGLIERRSFVIRRWILQRSINTRGRILVDTRMLMASFFMTGAVPQSLRGMPGAFGGQQQPQQGRSVSTRLPNGKLGI